MNIREAAHWMLVRNPWLGAALKPLRTPARSAVKRLQYRQIAAQSDRTELSLVHAATAARPGKVAAILTVRDERTRLPACLMHHRDLGIAEFHIVDNGSTDETIDYLRQQPDVWVYRTHESYRGAHYGITWVNAVMHRQVAGRWALFIDADELLYFDGMAEGETLHQLAERLEREGQSSFYAPLIDLYSFDDDAIAAANSHDALRAALKDGWHDIEGYKSSFPLGNGYLSLSGGPRERLAAQADGHAPSLVKYPMLRHRSDRYFTASAHEFMPQVEERHGEAGWLLHLKLGNLAHRRHADPAIEREHYGTGTERVRIAAGAAVQSLGGDPTAVHFDGLASLGRLNPKIRP